MSSTTGVPRPPSASGDSATDRSGGARLLAIGGGKGGVGKTFVTANLATALARLGKRVVVVDTRRTATCDVADLFLQIQPGSDGHLFGGLLNYLKDQKLLNQPYLDAHTSGRHDALAAVADLDANAVCQATGLTAENLGQFYQWFGETEKTVTVYSQGINQSATGTDKCNAIINCHLATGRIAQPGAGPFSITGS